VSERWQVVWLDLFSHHHTRPRADAPAVQRAQIATGYVQNGAKVYISSRTPSALKETADKLNKLGKGECIPIVADLSK
jgi:hypothetical protein